MKNVVFSKFSNERSRSFSIRTDILSDEAGRKTVRKSACYPEGISHVKNIVTWYQKLEELFSDTQIRVNRALPDGDEVELEFLEQGATLEERMRLLWQKGEKKEVCRWMGQYLDFLRQKATQPFEKTERFAAIFGDIDLTKGQKSMPVTDLDMVLENIVLTGEEPVWNLIDYEWTFDFPIPVNFIIYRIWHYFLGRIGSGEEEETKAYLREEGLTQQELQCYEQMEQTFQRYVTGQHVPIREMYRNITPGCIYLKSDEGTENSGLTREYRSTLSEMAVGEQAGENGGSVLYRMLRVDKEGNFSIELPIRRWKEQQGWKKGEALRWDPLERQMCRIRITGVTAEAAVLIRSENGYPENGWDVFWSYDPVYRLTGEFDKIQTIFIQGQLQVLHLEDILVDINTVRRERDADAFELERVRRELAAFQSTKGFKVLEKVRQLRNFIMARVRGLGLCSDKNSIMSPYQKWFLANQASPEELAAQRLSRLPCQPRISILVPTYNTPLDYLREMVESVQNQTYGNWELCIGDGSVSAGTNGAGGSRNRELAAVLKAYAEADSRIRYVLLEDNGGISSNTNGAATLATGDYITLLDHDDILAANALFEVAQTIGQTGADVIYTDEDKVSMDLKEHFDPNLKPDFSPDLLRSHNYITHLFVVKKSIFDSVGRFRSEYDGAQDYDLIFRCTEAAEQICHIPKVLYHWRMHKNSTAENPKSKLYAYEAGKKAIEDHLIRMGLKGRVEIMKMWGMNHVTYETTGNPLVSVIIPNKDHHKDLDRCLCSIMKKSSYRNLEFIIVENNSTKQETFAYYEKIQKQFSQVHVVRWEKEFNYSAINNFGVNAAKGDYLLLLNNDTELIDPDSIGEMLGCCMRKDVGCVGAKLLFADNTVQHAGIVLGFGGFAGHVFSGVKKDNLGFMMRTQIIGNYSVVTAACMMVRREVYEEAGGFSEKYAVALNDVDFCLKLRRAGYLVVFQPFSLWHHYESKSRGYEDTPAKKERFQKEIALFRSDWADIVDAGDPYYNPNFSVEREPFTLW